MSRHSELFERVARENGFVRGAGSENKPKPSGRLGPILPLHGRSRAEIEKAVTRLYRSSGPVASKVVVFTAFESASGCSWVCAHSGDLLAASTEASVCLVDANLQAPTLHKRMGVANSAGVTDLLGDSALNVKDVASKLPGSELWLLTAGASPVKEREGLVHSYRMRDRIAELRSCFDFVMIDAPAMSVCNDALALGQWADGVALVLRAGSTRRDFALSLKAELTASGVNVLGAILNDYASPIPKAIEKWL